MIDFLIGYILGIIVGIFVAIILMKGQLDDRTSNTTN